MYLIFQGRVAKNIEEKHLCEDQFDYYPQQENNKRLAVVSDGATESYASRDWAELLVAEFIQSFATTNQPIKVADVLQRATLQYQQRFAAQEKTWAQERSYLRGSFATLLALVEQEKNIDLYCVGDSLAVVLYCDNNGNIVHSESIPYTTASEFTAPPLPFASDMAMNEQLLQQGEFFTPTKRIAYPDTGYLMVLLMTDALGAWLLVENDDKNQQQQLRNERLQRLLNLRSSKELEELVLSERKNTDNKLKLDDVTLLVLSNKDLGITPQVEVLPDDDYPEIIGTANHQPTLQEPATKQPEKQVERHAETSPTPAQHNYAPQKPKNTATPKPVAFNPYSTHENTQRTQQHNTQQSANQTYRPKEENNTPKRKIFFMQILALLVVLLVGITIGLLMSGKGKEKWDKATNDVSKKREEVEKGVGNVTNGANDLTSKTMEKIGKHAEKVTEVTKDTAEKVTEVTKDTAKQVQEKLNRENATNTNNTNNDCKDPTRQSCANTPSNSSNSNGSPNENGIFLQQKQRILACLEQADNVSSDCQFVQQACLHKHLWQSQPYAHDPDIIEQCKRLQQKKNNPHYE